MRRTVLSFFLATAVLSCLTWSRPAWAQSDPNIVDPTAKGIIGCALLGGEVALLVESIAGVKNGWALGLIPTVTAIGGGIGGYFLEQNADAELSVAALVAGMALVIPTTIIVLKSTAYSVEEEAGWVDTADDEEAAPSGAADQEGTTVEHVEEPAPAEEAPATPPAEEAPAPAPAPEGGGGGAPGPSGSLIDIGPHHLAIGLPAVQVLGTYSRTEVRHWGLTQQTELRVPLLSGSF